MHRIKINPFRLIIGSLIEKLRIKKVINRITKKDRLCNSVAEILEGE